MCLYTGTGICEHTHCCSIGHWLNYNFVVCYFELSVRFFFHCICFAVIVIEWSHFNFKLVEIIENHWFQIFFSDGKTGYLCPRGKYCPGGTPEPLDCLPGGYSDRPGLANCTLCEPGFYCPQGTTNYTSFPCEPGYFCPKGLPRSVTLRIRHSSRRWLRSVFAKNSLLNFFSLLFFRSIHFFMRFRNQRKVRAPLPPRNVRHPRTGQIGQRVPGLSCWKVLFGEWKYKSIRRMWCWWVLKMLFMVWGYLVLMETWNRSTAYFCITCWRSGLVRIQQSAQ